MDHNKVYKALETLREYPAITDYIKSFTGLGGFMYTKETDPERIELNKQMNDILNDCTHSGASWGSMMRNVQAVLKGVITVEQLQEEERIKREQTAAALEAAGENKEE